jgi:3-oxoacyl-[acyl-carrier protein] reductase
MSHCIVSGGTRGLGEAIVRALLENGWTVSTFGRRSTPFVESTAAAQPDHFYFYQADTADPAAVDKAIHAMVERSGAPFALINNAGIARDGVLASFPIAEIDAVVATNLVGPLYVTRAVVRHMLLQRTGGRILNISSIIGHRGYNGLSVYAATKAALDGMTRSLARELGPRSITVNSIAPGYLETEMTHGLSTAQRGQIVRRTPLGRLGSPADVIGVVKFLLSAEASFLTGQSILIDGGISC